MRANDKKRESFIIFSSVTAVIAIGVLCAYANFGQRDTCDLADPSPSAFLSGIGDLFSTVLTIEAGGDHDWFTFVVPPGAEGWFVRIETVSDMPGSFTDDTDLTLWGDCVEDLPGNPGTFVGDDFVAFDDDAGGNFTSLINTECLARGTYYLEVGGFADISPADNFTLEIEVSNTCLCPSPCPNPFADAFCAISGVVATTTDTAVRDKWEDALKKLEQAIAKLCQGDNIGALGDVEGTVGDLDAAVNAGLNPALAQQLRDELVDASRQLAEDVLKAACVKCGPNESKVCDALEKMDEGDNERLSGNHQTAVSKYKDAKSLAEDVIALGYGCNPSTCTFSCI